MIKITKNRERELPTFANINLLGNCNANCYFCLGKDIKEELKGKNQLEIHYKEWTNIIKFISLCKEKNIKNIYITGQTADGLQYKYLSELITCLQTEGFKVGIRTNGYLFNQKESIINQLDAGVGYSIHTLKPEVSKQIMGSSFIPNWNYILNNSGPNVRVSIVLNRYNKDEFYDLLDYIASFKTVRYIQVRRISTDTRFELLKEDIELYENIYKEFKEKFEKTGQFYTADQFNYKGKEVDFWRTVETSIGSLNYFTDGTISDEYFIVEGYLKNRKEEK